MTMIETDICVIGAGAGGLSVASGAVQMGARVVLIEAGEMGGDCLNTGCVPSKALLAAAAQAQSVRRGGLGTAGTTPQIDMTAVRQHVTDVIAGIAPHDSQERFEGLGCTVLRARAEFTSERDVRAGPHQVRARRFVIATGSVPVLPPIPGLADIGAMTNETLFDLHELPEHLIVIGAGPIGLEMAQAHHRLGAKVTVVEAATPLARDDAELAARLVDALRAEGVTILTETRVERAAREGGDVVLTTSGGVVRGSHVLVATGRKPTVEGLGLEAAGVRHGPTGIEVDARMRSSNRRIYAIGDVAGQGQFTHMAGYHAGVILRGLCFGLPAKARTDHIPSVTYTAPELAQVGMTEEDARATHGARLTVITEEFSGNDRARAEGRGHGILKLMVVKGRPVGVSILGPDAGNLIAPWAMMIANRQKLSVLAGTVLPYPTLSEINKRAAGAYFTPMLFENPWVKRGVRMVQRLLP